MTKTEVPKSYWRPSALANSPPWHPMGCSRAGNACFVTVVGGGGNWCWRSGLLDQTGLIFWCATTASMGKELPPMDQRNRYLRHFARLTNAWCQTAIEMSGGFCFRNVRRQGCLAGGRCLVWEVSGGVSGRTGLRRSVRPERPLAGRTAASFAAGGRRCDKLRGQGVEPLGAVRH
jgi:hypothetical protein